MPLLAYTVYRNLSKALQVCRWQFEQFSPTFTWKTWGGSAFTATTNQPHTKGDRQLIYIPSINFSKRQERKYQHEEEEEQRCRKSDESVKKEDEKGRVEGIGRTSSTWSCRRHTHWNVHVLAQCRHPLVAIYRQDRANPLFLALLAHSFSLVSLTHSFSLQQQHSYP